MGRCGGPVTASPLPPLPLLLFLAVLLAWCAGVGVAAARLPHSNGGRLAPGPSVEDDNPLPSSNHASGTGNQAGANAAGQQRRCAALSNRVLRQVLGPAYNPAYMAFSLEEPRGGDGGFGGFQSRGHDPRDTRGTGMDDGGAGEFEQHPSRVLKESPWGRDAPGAASPFAVDEDFVEVLSDEPAWQVRYEMPTVMLSSDAKASGGGGGGGGGLNYRTSSGRRGRGHDPERFSLNGDAGDLDSAADGYSDGYSDGYADGGGSRAGRAVWGGMSLAALSKDMQWHCESPLRWLDLGPDYFPRFLRSADCGHPTCTGAGFVCRPRSFSVKVLRRREGVCAPAGDLPLEESTVGLPNDLRDLWVWELRAVNFCCVCNVRM